MTQPTKKTRKPLMLSGELYSKKIFLNFPQEDGISFPLILDDQEIYFEGKEVSKVSERKQDENGQYRFNLEWILHTINISEGFSRAKEEVFTVISEALSTYGEFYDHERVDSVSHTDDTFHYKINLLRSEDFTSSST